MTTPVKTLYILDGSYYIFRAFYAIRNMSNSDGMPTNGLFAFTGMLLNLIRDRSPDYLVVTFDPSGDTFRNELFPAYKANRSEAPEDLIPQFPWFRRIVESLNIPIVEVPGFEADDAIATLCRHASRGELPIVVLTGDKDLYQLVDERTTLEDSMRDKRVDIAAVIERFQVGPEGVADVLGLAGDTSDNIPGVPGIGEKTAGQLIAEFGSVENLLANIDKVSGAKRKQNLAEFADQARLSKVLATVRDDVPLDFNMEKFRLDPPDFVAFEELCTKFGFNRYRTTIREIFSEANAEVEAAAQAELSNADEYNYRAVITSEELDSAIAAIRAAGRCSFDLETTSLDQMEAAIVGFSFSWKAGDAVYIPVGHTADLFSTPQLGIDDVLARLKPLLEDPAIQKVAQHGKYDISILARYGVVVQGFNFDTMLAAYLLDPNKRRYGMDALAEEFLKHKTITFEEVAGKGKEQKTFDQVSVEDATTYAAEDADITLRLADVLEAELKDTPLLALLRDVEVPLTRVLSGMERAGIRVDTNALNVLSVEFTSRLAELEKEIYKLAGDEFTINSPKQLGYILFEKLQLPVQRRTKTGPSTDQSVLEKLAPMHPLPATIIAWRELAKLLSTYVDALPLLVRPDTGRVHTSFNQAVAATGRLSSSNPNLQNIPIRSMEGRRIRSAFVPEPGWVLIGGDYSQIELRVLAHLSDEPSWIEAFNEGQDIHRRTASEIFGTPLADVTSEQRAAAKTINFGIIYGMGAQSLAASLGISVKEAKEYIENYFARVSRVKGYFDEQIDRARELGYAETIIGRRRPIPELRLAKGRDSAFGERLAMNTPIQGSAADLIKVAMVNMDKALTDGAFKTRMLVQVHDELLFEAPPEEVATVMPVIRTTMEQVWELKVPLLVELNDGPSWAELK
jgi:DNA polymerase-1